MKRRATFWLAVLLITAAAACSSAPASPPAAPVLSVGFGIKQLQFTWTASSGATSYRLLQNPDGISGFTQVEADIAANSASQNVDIAVHQVNWSTARYALDACNSAGCTRSNQVSIAAGMLQTTGYFKASNSGTGDFFGFSIALSGDGNTMAVGAPNEDSAAIGVNGNQNDESLANAGAVYVFARSDGSWSQQAYIKASNAGPGDQFGLKLALGGDGNTLAVGAIGEASSVTGINGVQADNSAAGAGAAYVFVRNGGTWAQQAYIKASNTAAGDGFGTAVALNGDGNILAVAAITEGSAATGINGNQADNSAAASGAVYVFARSNATWSQEAYVKASNTGTGDLFGWSVALSGDGSTLAVGSERESSAATGINGNQADNSAFRSGAVYAFARDAGIWSQQAYIKASNSEASDEFGFSVALNRDGNILIAGARAEESSATGVGGNQGDNSAPDSGATYVFTRTGGVWAQQAYLKASNGGGLFGSAVSVTDDGTALAVGAILESSPATGINGSQLADISALGAGAIYFFVWNGNTWSQQSYIKASNTGINDRLGISLALSGNGSILAAGAEGEDSAAAGVNGNQAENSAGDSGAIYIY